MNLISGTVGCFVAIACFAVIMECPRRYIALAGITGAVGGGIYLLSVDCGLDVVMASFLSAFSITLMSHVFARVFRAPVTIFLIPGILPTVPGAGMYRIVYYMMAGERGMCSYYFVQTLEIAGVIALAIFLVGTIFNMVERYFLKNRKK